MTIDWWTLGLQTINFLVLAWLLQHFLYRPVLAMIDRRRAETDAVRAKAAEAERRAQEVEAEWRARTDGLEAERLEMRRQAEAQVVVRTEEMMTAARSQAGNLLVEARETIAAERQAAAAVLTSQAAGVAVTLANRLLVTVAPGVGPAPFIDMLIGRLAELTPVDRAALTSGPLRLELAPSIDEPARETARRRIAAALGDAPAVEIADAPAMIAGARLAGPAATLEVSWAAVLAAAKGEMEKHDHLG